MDDNVSASEKAVVPTVDETTLTVGGLEVLQLVTARYGTDIETACDLAVSSTCRGSGRKVANQNLPSDGAAIHHQRGCRPNRDYRIVGQNRTHVERGIRGEQARKSGHAGKTYSQTYGADEDSCSHSFLLPMLGHRTR